MNCSLHRTTIVILTLSLTACRHSRVERAAARETSAVAFLAACRVPPDDRRFQEGTVLALVHGIGTTSSILYGVRDGTPAFIAELHHPSSEVREFVEAQGGVRSTVLAGDVVASLRARPFFLVSDWRRALGSDQHSIAPCEIRYVDTDRYDRVR